MIVRIILTQNTPPLPPILLWVLASLKNGGSLGKGEFEQVAARI